MINRLRILSKLSFIKIISLELLAISVPLAIATPIVAVARLGASFIPSPTIITFLFSFNNSFIIVVFSLGRSDAFTSSSAKSLLIILAVSLLSPVNIKTFLLLFFNFLITSLALLLSVSLTPIKAITFLSSTT